MKKTVRLTESELVRLVKTIINEQDAYNPTRGLKNGDFLYTYVNGDTSKIVNVGVRNPWDAGNNEKKANFYASGLNIKWAGPYNPKTLEFEDTKGNKYKVIKLDNVGGGKIEVLTLGTPKKLPQLPNPSLTPKDEKLLPPETLKKLEDRKKSPTQQLPRRPLKGTIPPTYSYEGPVG
jgi:hypothetical protein